MKIRKAFRSYSRMLVGAAVIASTFALPLAAQNNSAKQSDEAFIRAATSGKTTALSDMLDQDFTWTDAEGQTLDKLEVLRSAPKPASADAPFADLTDRSYGDVEAIMSHQGKTHVLRIWVKRAAGWRLLAYHEVVQKNEPPAPGGTGVTDCQNPCKNVPFEPKNADEKAVIESWQALETGVTGHDSAAWEVHVTDDFIQVSSNSDRVLDKAGRMAVLDRQKQSGVGAAPAPLVSARMYDFGGTIVMTCLHQPYTGKPVQVTRVWIKQSGKWVMAISFQTAVQAAEAKAI